MTNYEYWDTIVHLYKDKNNLEKIEEFKKDKAIEFRLITKSINFSNKEKEILEFYNHIMKFQCDVFYDYSESKKILTTPDDSIYKSIDHETYLNANKMENDILYKYRQYQYVRMCLDSAVYDMLKNNLYFDLIKTVKFRNYLIYKTYISLINKDSELLDFIQSFGGDMGDENLKNKTDEWLKYSIDALNSILL